MSVEVRLLGRFAVLADGSEVPAAQFGGRKTRQLIRVLAVHRGEPVSHDTLADALWGSATPADPAGNLGVLVNRARGALHDATLIRTTPRGYLLDGACRVDAVRFADGVAAARRAPDPGEALARYRDALSHWARPLAEDDDAEWAAAYRAGLDRTHQAALEEASAVALEASEPAAAAALAAEAVAVDPLREVAHLALIRALLAAGDRAAALAAFESLRRTLAAELGVDPSPAARELHLAILREDDEPAGAQPVPFAGRADECQAAHQHLAAGRAVLITGRAGMGKSRLLAEVLRGAGNGPVWRVRAVQPEQGEPLSLATQVLRAAIRSAPEALRDVPARARAALAWLLPEIGAVPDLDPPARAALLRLATERVLRSAAPALIVLDDLQWADPASLELLGGTAQRVPGLRWLMAGRPEAPALLDPFLIRLQPLTHADLVGLAGPDLAAVLAQTTDRSPFAVTDVLRELGTGGAPPDRAARARALGIAGFRRTIAAGAQQQREPARQIARMLAVLARPASTALLARATGRDEDDVLTALGELTVSGLAQPGPAGWATSHDLVAETLAADLDDAARVALHARLASAVTDPGERARHLEAAGDAPAAALAYTQAARDRLAAHAVAEAESAADRGLGLAASPDLLDLRAQARAVRGDLARARADLRAALALTPAGPVRADRLSRLAVLCSGAEDLQRAREVSDLALVETEPAGTPAPVRARALEVASILDMNLGDGDRAAVRAEQARSLYTSIGDSAGVARVLDGRAMAAFLDGDIAAAADLFDRVATLFEDTGDLFRVITPRSTQGHALVFLDRAADGLSSATAALQLARMLGHPEGETYALWHCAEAHAALGAPEQAAATASAALEIAVRIDHRGWTATAWRASGIAALAAGDADRALDAFARSYDRSSGLPLFAAWARAQAALTLVVLGRAGEARPFAEEALAGPGLAGYEARLAHCEVLVATGRPHRAAAREALHRAEDGGHRASVRRLRELADAGE